jgi:hypothetical protein
VRFHHSVDPSACVRCGGHSAAAERWSLTLIFMT